MAGSTTGIVKVNAAGAGGSVSLTPVAALTSAITDTLSIYSGGLPVVLSCGSTGSGNQTCTPGAVNGKQQIYVGESTLSGNGATITFPNTFTSTTSYFCIGQDVTTRANVVQMVPASGTTRMNQPPSSLK